VRMVRGGRCEVVAARKDLLMDLSSRGQYRDAVGAASCRHPVLAPSALRVRVQAFAYLRPGPPVSSGPGHMAIRAGC